MNLTTLINDNFNRPNTVEIGLTDTDASAFFRDNYDALIDIADDYWAMIETTFDVYLVEQTTSPLDGRSYFTFFIANQIASRATARQSVKVTIDEDGSYAIKMSSIEAMSSIDEATRFTKGVNAIAEWAHNYTRTKTMVVS
jgi:hypothetical protein